MSINSVGFLLGLLPIIIWLYASYLRSNRLRLIGLLVASCIFYLLAGGSYLLILGVQAAATFMVGRHLLGSTSPTRRRLGFWLGLGNLAPLLLVKYFQLFAAQSAIQSTGQFIGLLGTNSRLIPLGISFFTFNLLSYVIDVYQRRTPPAASLLEFATYATFFPTISAGPLMRYDEFEPQEDDVPNPTWERASFGLQRLVIGLAKKALVADQLAKVIDPALSGYSNLQLIDSWLAIAGYHFQIYFDFSGYSDIAIGIGALLGLRIPENFDAPYRSTSIADFWRRWHITLSFWFRDYVFLPLSRGALRAKALSSRFLARAIALILTMALIGAWHGPTWTFVIFGAYHGVLLSVDPIWQKLTGRRTPDLLSRAGTTLLLMFGWALFRSSSIPMAISLFGSMAGFNGLGAGTQLLTAESGLWLIALLLALFILTNLDVQHRGKLAGASSWYAIALAILLVIALLMDSGQSPFIYYNF